MSDEQLATRLREEASRDIPDDIPTEAIGWLKYAAYVLDKRDATIARLTAELAAEREKFDKMSAVAATERHRAAAEYERGFAEGKAFVERQVHAAIDAALKETADE